MFFFFNYNPYVAIIGDIKESKKIKNRNEVQAKLKKILDEINKFYAKDISSKFILTLGDEFQGLLCNGANAVYIISKIERKMYPIKIRFGVGIGEIITDIDREMAIGADGPGFHKAREAIEYLKANEKRNQTNTADSRFEFDGENQASTIMINTILSLMTVIKDSWSDRQREIIWDLLEYRDSQANVAKRLNITQPSVQKSLAKGKYYAYMEAINTISNAMEEIKREDV